MDYCQNITAENINVSNKKLLIDVISKKAVDILAILEPYTFTKHISYGFIPVICFESSCKCYVNNPYLKDIIAKKYPNFLAIVDTKYEAWGDWTRRFIIRDEKTVKKIIKKSVDFIKSNNKRVAAVSTKDFSVLSALEVYDVLKELDTILTDLYHLYIFFIDECFEVNDAKLNNELPDVRMKLSDFVAKLYQECDMVIEALSGLFPDIDWRNFTHATVGEIGQLVSDPQKYTRAFKKLKNRSIVFIAINNKLHTFVGKDAVSIKNYIYKQNKVGSKLKQEQFSGAVAYQGKAVGKVLKVLESDYKNIDKLVGKKKNYVLVTPMTRPEIISIIRNASAIITDEGGITCHAAIVARELKKPCIVGSMIATQALNDGDMVEVDAMHGVVKIIK